MEKILCAAVWYDDEEVHLEQPIDIKSGLVFCGFRHGQPYQMIWDCIGKDVNKAKCRAGFLTNANRFVERGEAFKIAKEAKQVVGPMQDAETAILISEDLY